MPLQDRDWYQDELEKKRADARPRGPYFKPGTFDRMRPYAAGVPAWIVVGVAICTFVLGVIVGQRWPG
jgi:hypothetical protein